VKVTPVAHSIEYIFSSLNILSVGSAHKSRRRNQQESDNKSSFHGHFLRAVLLCYYIFCLAPYA